MRLEITQTFAGPLEAVEEAFLNPGFLARMRQIPKLGGAELLEQRTEGHLVHQRVRYAFTGNLSSAARAVINPDKLTWVEDSTLDRRTHTTAWRIVPDHYPDRLRCTGRFELTAIDANTTRRTTQADLKVHLALVGGKVEQAIASGLREHAGAEEDVMAAWLASSSKDG